MACLTLPSSWLRAEYAFASAPEDGEGGACSRIELKSLYTLANENRFIGCAIYARRVQCFGTKPISEPTTEIGKIVYKSIKVSCQRYDGKILKHFSFFRLQVLCRCRHTCKCVYPILRTATIRNPLTRCLVLKVISLRAQK